MNDVFLELSIVVAISAGISIIMRALKQPLIIGYILAGIILGPAVLNAVTAADTVDSLAKFGIALLLFIIGLGLNPKVIKEVGRVAFFTGVGQVMFTTTAGWLIAQALGYNSTSAIYIAVALAFSSTIIVLKLLSDKKEQQRLYGKISIGFLLVQDILATIALIVASASGEGDLSFSSVGGLMAKGLGLGAIIWLVVRYVLPLIRGLITGSQELLFVFAIAWGFGVASIFEQLGFSLEVGALAAGVALATQPFAMEVGSRLRPLRDFFVVLFFVALGTHLELASSIELLPQALILSAFVLIGNPIIVMSIMGLLNFTKKTSFKAGLAVAQISEFSLVFILLGRQLEQVDDQIVSLITMVGLITIAISSYMITYADGLYDKLEKYLSVFERSKPRSDNIAKSNPELVLIGYKKGGDQYVKLFKSMSKRYLVIDYDPEQIDMLEQAQISHSYGDVTDIEFLDELEMDKAKLVISTTNDFHTNSFLASYYNRSDVKTVFICSADTKPQATFLYDNGVAYVLMPHFVGGQKIVSFIKKSGLKKSSFKEHRQKHIKNLKEDEPSGKPKSINFGRLALKGSDPKD